MEEHFANITVALCRVLVQGAQHKRGKRETRSWARRTDDELTSDRPCMDDPALHHDTVLGAESTKVLAVSQQDGTEIVDCG